MNRLVVLVAAVLLAAAACAGAPPVPSPSPIVLEGTSWRAILVDGGRPVVGAEPTVAFGGARVQGTDGCNSYGGDVVFTGSGFHLGEIASTLILCEGQVGVISGAFLTILGDVKRIGMIDGRLVLAGPAGEIVLVPVVG